MFRIISKEFNIEVLKRSAELKGFKFVDHIDPNTAYEKEIITFNCDWLEEKPVSIVIRRDWEPDGVSFNDSNLQVQCCGEILLDIEIMPKGSNNSNAQVRKDIGTRIEEILEELSGTKYYKA